MSENNQLAKPEFKTSLIKVQDQYLGMIESQLASHRVQMDGYQKNCVINAISAINTMMDKSGVSFAHKDVDQSSITNILLTVAALKLNASATPREVYFQMRNVGKTTRNPETLQNTDQKKWMKVVEMGIEGDGNDALLRRFGAEIDKVGQYWLIRENDEFTPPKYVGMNVEPPTWIPKGSGRVIMVVYPIRKKDGSEEYHMTTRDDVKPNLMAHMSNNMMNETFGLAADRYKANQSQQEKIAEKKKEIISRADAMTIDEILDEKDFEPWISPAWRDPHSRDLMIVRKMRNNIVKKIPKDFGSGFQASVYDQQGDIDETPAVITRDIGGDFDPEPRQLVDINPEPENEPDQLQVKPPRTRPQPVKVIEHEPADSHVDPVKTVDDQYQIEF